MLLYIRQVKVVSMNRLSIGQLKSLSDFLNKIAVAWFSIGVVTPFLTKPETIIQSVKIPIGGTIMAFIFLFFSLAMVKGVKS